MRTNSNWFGKEGFEHRDNKTSENKTWRVFPHLAQGDFKHVTESRQTWVFEAPW